MKTLTGKTRDQVVEAMTAVLKPDAYKEVGGAPYLTDINPAYLKEVATQCFGLIGEGWWFEYYPGDMTLTFDGRPAAALKKLALYYRYINEDGELTDSFPILSPGGSDNKKAGDAMKGAVTDALGKCFSNLLWQLGIYKGEFSHKDVPTGNGNQQGSQSSQNGNTETKHKRNWTSDKSKKPATAGLLLH